MRWPTRRSRSGWTRRRSPTPGGSPGTRSPPPWPASRPTSACRPRRRSRTTWSGAGSKDSFPKHPFESYLSIMADFEHRELRDPRALRAMAHPVRLRLMEELLIRGPATATELAERVGENPANCSWHLRQLAKYGFVEEAGGGTGRQRPWQIVPKGQRWGGPDQ